MPQERKGRNGGTLRSQSPGDPSLNQNGRPVGSTSLKAIADKILDKEITVEEAEGIFTKMTRREAMLLRIIEDAVNDEDPNVRMRAAQIVMERTEGRPDQKLNLSGNLGNNVEGTTVTPEMIAQIDRLLSGEQTTDDEGATLPGKRKGQR